MLSLRLVRAVCVSSALSLLSFAQSSPVVLPNGAGSLITGDDLEGDLNCDEVVFARLGLRSIVQNVPAMGPEFGGRMRWQAKLLTVATVVGSESVLHSYFEQGLLAGLEFDWFFPTGGQAPTTNRLPGEVEVFVLGPEGERELVAKVYGYDAQQYAKRRSMVQMMIMHPMRVYPVWTEDVVTAAGGEESPLAITGMTNRIHGRAAAGGALFLTGIENALVDGAIVSGESVIFPRNQVASLTHGDVGGGPSVPFTEPEARNLARSSGLYAAGDLELDADDLPTSGIVFAEGTIHVNACDLAGRYTFVSASGAIHFHGGRSALRPYLSDVLAVSFAQGVAVSGDGNAFLGELHAPQGTVEVTGSRNTLVGILAARSVAITGSHAVVSDGTHPSALD